MELPDTPRRGAWTPLGAILVASASTLLPIAPAAARAEATAPATSLTSADWRSDLDFARAELPRRHANLWHTLTPAAYEAEFDRLAGDLERLQEHEIILRLAQIVASVGDGHSRLTLPMDPGAGFFSGHSGTAEAHVTPFRHLPLRLDHTGDGYVVTRAAAGLEQLLGARLAGIDGRDVAAIESALSPLVNRDNEHQLYHLMPTFMVVPEVLHARGISESPAASRWKVIDAAGRHTEMTLEPVARGSTVAWKNLPAPGWPRTDTARQEEGLWFADIPEPAAVYVRIAEIADTPSRTFARFADQLGGHLATTAHRRLIIDLRGNPGGDNSLNPPLVRALIRTPWVAEPGALLVLIDGGTFSAAMNLAEDLERWLPAVFVGSGTGARPNSYGDARKLELPRSGLTVRLSSLYWQNHPNDQRAAIEPLIATPRTAAQLRSSTDPAGEVLARLDTRTESLSDRWRGRLAVEFRHEDVELTLPAEGNADGGTFAAPGLGLAEVPIGGLEREATNLRGVLTVRGGTRVPIAARLGGERLVGWLEYRGNRYPFVLTRP